MKAIAQDAAWLSTGVDFQLVTVVDLRPGQATVRLDERELTVDPARLSPAHSRRVDEVDLCQLACLDEAELLAHLQERYCSGRIYSGLGGTVIAVNPYR